MTGFRASISENKVLNAFIHTIPGRLNYIQGNGASQRSRRNWLEYRRSRNENSRMLGDSNPVEFVTHLLSL